MLRDEALSRWVLGGLEYGPSNPGDRYAAPWDYDHLLIYFAAFLWECDKHYAKDLARINMIDGVTTTGVNMRGNAQMPDNKPAVRVDEVGLLMDQEFWDKRPELHAKMRVSKPGMSYDPEVFPVGMFVVADADIKDILPYAP